MRWWGAAWAAVIVAAGGAAVFFGHGGSDAPTPLFAGCARISQTSVCDLEPGADFRVWLEGGPFTDVEVRLDGRTLAVTTATVSGGLRLTVTPNLTDAPSTLTVSARAGRIKRGLSVTVRRSRSFETPDWNIERVEQFRRVEAWVQAHPGPGAIEALLSLARTARVLSRPELAIEYQARAAAMAQAHEEWSLEQGARFARTYTLAYDVFNIEEAHRELDRVEALRDQVPVTAAYLPYYRSMVYTSGGDMTSTLAELRKAAAFGEALGEDPVLYLVDGQRAGVDLELGYFDAALTRLRRMYRWSATHDRPCQEAHAATNIGWTLILRQNLEASWGLDPEVDRGADDAFADETPTSYLLRALEVYGADCEDPEGLPIVHLNLALAALQVDDADKAEYWLDEVQYDQLLVRNRPWLDETRARIAVARGQLNEALVATDQMLQTAQNVSDVEGVFRAWVLSAEVLSLLGRFDDALEARLRAELALDRLATRVPLVGARHSFLALRDDNVLGLTELLLAQKRPGEALNVIRRARSRSLGWARVSQGLAQLSDEQRAEWNTLLGRYQRERSAIDREIETEWQRPVDELEAERARRAQREVLLDEFIARALDLLPSVPKELTIDPEVLRLAWIRLRTGVWVIGQRGNDTFAIPWDERATTVPAEVERRLPHASRVLLHPYGRMRDRDLHMLLADGLPLAARVPTAYAVDLADTEPPAPPRTALVVVDPAVEFAFGQEEADLVLRSLRNQGVSVEKQRGAVTELRDALRRTDWFHFGGHGHWSPEDPMAGGLALAEGARFGIGDILTAPGMPSTVVLSSCETGRNSGRGGEGFGVAHAFLVAGARVVVAPNRVVTDQEAYRFSKALYGPGDQDVLARYRAVVETLGPDAGSFRVFVP